MFFEENPFFPVEGGERKRSWGRLGGKGDVEISYFQEFPEGEGVDADAPGSAAERGVNSLRRYFR